MKNKFLPLLLISALWAVVATGCNTTEGVGKDIEKAGNKIQDAAK
jgi:predicted small secreted protein